MSGFSGASNGLQKSATTMLSKNDKIESLYEQINWDAVVRDQILRLRDHQVLSRSHDNLEVVLDDKADAQELGRILMKLSDTPNDVNLVKYALHRSEHILGLLPKSNDQDDTSGSDTASNMGEGSLGIQHAHIFTFGGVYINDHGIVKALLCPDNDVQKSAGLVFAALLNVYEGDSKRLLQWIVSKLISTMDDAWELALPALSMCARTTSAGRKYALIEMGVVQHIVAVLTGLDVKGRTQQVYELCFVLWVLSLGELQTEPFLSAGVVHTLVELLSTAPTRKIVRMALATLANLAVTEDDALLNEMFTVGLLKVLDSMKHNNFNRDAADEDVENDLKSLYHVLTRNYRELSSYERWVTQVYSGTLRWSIVHTEKFWRENARFVEEDNFKALKKLLELLKSDDAQVVSVALYDVGEFSRFYPNGRVIGNSTSMNDPSMATPSRNIMQRQSSKKSVPNSTSNRSGFILGSPAATPDSRMNQPLSGKKARNKLEILVVARFEKLSIEVQHVLRTASVIGMTFSRDVLYGILPSSLKSDMSLYLGVLLAQSWLYRDFADDGLFQFAHSYSHGVIYQLTPLNERKLTHGKVAQYLVDTSEGDPSQFALISEQFRLCANMDSALQYAIQAVIFSLDKESLFDIRDSIELLNASVDCCETNFDIQVMNVIRRDVLMAVREFEAQSVLRTALAAANYRTRNEKFKMSSDSRHGASFFDPSYFLCGAAAAVSPSFGTRDDDDDDAGSEEDEFADDNEEAASLTYFYDQLQDIQSLLEARTYRISNNVSSKGAANGDGNGASAGGEEAKPWQKEFLHLNAPEEDHSGGRMLTGT